jgi:hypothetical protein
MNQASMMQYEHKIKEIKEVKKWLKAIKTKNWYQLIESNTKNGQ